MNYNFGTNKSNKAIISIISLSFILQLTYDDFYWKKTCNGMTVDIKDLAKAWSN